MKVLLIIPAYNEEESIGSLLKELRNFPEYDYIVINDCSSDSTENVVLQYTNKIINLPINLGLSGAIQTGMVYAKRNDYDVCVQIDGDGQHMPSEIKKLIAELENGADIAMGSRFLEKEQNTYEQSFLRDLGAKYISFLMRILSGLKLTDPTSGMRAFKKEVYAQMANAVNERPEPDTILYFARRKYKITEVQVTMRERMAGESYLTTSKAIKYMLNNSLSFFYVFVKTLRRKEKAR